MWLPVMARSGRGGIESWCVVDENSQIRPRDNQRGDSRFRTKYAQKRSSPAGDAYWLRSADDVTPTGDRAARCDRQIHRIRRRSIDSQTNGPSLSDGIAESFYFSASVAVRDYIIVRHNNAPSNNVIVVVPSKRFGLQYAVWRLDWIYIYIFFSFITVAQINTDAAAVKFKMMYVFCFVRFVFYFIAEFFSFLSRTRHYSIIAVLRGFLMGDGGDL